MNRRDVTKPNQDAILDAYRAAAHAEADAHFDDRALEAQRHKILARLANMAHPAKVIRFPASAPLEAPVASVNRRWISVAAAAGLIIGLLGGQVVNLVPPQTRRLAPMATSIAPSANTVTSYVPARITLPQDDGLLGEVDFAVQLRSASELRTLDELTPFHEPQ
jgi:hypothetical protein